MQVKYSRGEKKNCVVCRRKTVNAYEYGYVDGISIRVPVCEKCKGEVGLCLGTAMDAHLKGINQSVTVSRIITSDEKQLREIYRKEREKGGSVG